MLGSCKDRVDRVEIGLVVGLKSGSSRKWSCGGRVRSSSGRKEVVYEPYGANYSMYINVSVNIVDIY